MARSPKNHPTCSICGKAFPPSQLMPGELVRDAIARQIRAAHPDWTATGYICVTDLNKFRNEYVRSLIAADQGELSSLEREVVESLVRHETLSVDTEKEWEQTLSFGERLADKVADFGGSWRFIMLFFALMAVWMAINLGVLITKPFDPYPFILLNLALSCLAAVQAPIIMMSQNRQEARDRLRAKNDYQINLKAELEIRQLHEKVDHLLRKQWERLMEIQEIQIEIMSETGRHPPAHGAT
jgi:uncharacterized membrane protein